MKLHRIVMSVLLIVAISVAAGPSALAQKSDSEAKSASSWLPNDVNYESLSRVTPPKREDLDPEGQKLLDKNAPSDALGTNIARMYNPTVSAGIANVRGYLNNKSGLDKRQVQVATLVAAREMNCQQIWYNHALGALKDGVPQDVVDIIQLRKPLAGVDEKDAAIIQVGREVLNGLHQVSSPTYARALKAYGFKVANDLVSLMGLYAMTCVQTNFIDQHMDSSHPAVMAQQGVEKRDTGHDALKVP